MRLDSFRRRKLVLRLILIMAALVLVAFGSYEFWLYHRPLPDNIRENLFQGITYIRDVRRTPRPLVIHIVMVDLNTPNLSFLVTPGEHNATGELQARTNSQFLTEYQLQLSINRNFFTPWWSHSIFDYYPHSGDPVDVTGLASSRGDIYSPAEPDHPTLFLSRDNRAQIGTSFNNIYNAISGNAIFVEGGQVTAQFLSSTYNDDLHPRTAVALDQTGRMLLLFIVDGRQPNYSEGLTLAELGRIVIAYGGYVALNLDGGGSTTLTIAGPDGQAIDLNSPIDIGFQAENDRSAII